MEEFEAKLAQATSPTADGFMLGAIGLVVNRQGKILYHHAAGRQSPADDAPALDPDSTISWTALTKFVTNIASLQLVERGLVHLDEPLAKHIPELDRLPLVRERDGDSPFVIGRPSRGVTLRDCLTHTSGLTNEDEPFVAKFLASEHGASLADDDAISLVKVFSLPLLFEPGEGFNFGRSTYVLQYLVQKMGGKNFVWYVKENVFDPLGMSTATYGPNQVPSTWNRRLHMVEPEDGGKLVSRDEKSRGFTCSMTDLAKLLTDMLSPSSKLLSEESMKLILEPQLSPAQRRSLQSDPENFSFVAGHRDGGDGDGGGAAPPEVSWTAGGLLYVEEQLEHSGFPPGTVTWEGLGNVLFGLNKERGLAVLFGTQHLPWDRRVNEVACSFTRAAWKTF